MQMSKIRVSIIVCTKNRLTQLKSNTKLSFVTILSSLIRVPSEKAVSSLMVRLSCVPSMILCHRITELSSRLSCWRVTIRLKDAEIWLSLASVNSVFLVVLPTVKKSFVHWLILTQFSCQLLWLIWNFIQEIVCQRICQGGTLSPICCPNHPRLMTLYPLRHRMLTSTMVMVALCIKMLTTSTLISRIRILQFMTSPSQLSLSPCLRLYLAITLLFQL